MSTARSHYRPHYTAEDYKTWPGRWELWYGTAVCMSPSPFGRHGAMAVEFSTLFNIAVKAASCSASVLSEVDWNVSSDTIVRPDVSIVCGPPPEGYIEAAPALVVEVLSDATRLKDLNEKKHLYAENGIRWYIIGEPDNSSVQVLKLGESGEYESLASDQPVAIDICDGCELAVDFRPLSQSPG